MRWYVFRKYLLCRISSLKIVRMAWKNHKKFFTTVLPFFSSPFYSFYLSHVSIFSPWLTLTFLWIKRPLFNLQLGVYCKYSQCDIYLNIERLFEAIWRKVFENQSKILNRPSKTMEKKINMKFLLKKKK